MDLLQARPEDPRRARGQLRADDDDGPRGDMRRHAGHRLLDHAQIGGVVIADRRIMGDEDEPAPGQRLHGR